MLKCEALTKYYDKKCIVNQLSFEVKRGEVFALLGSNGAGKTTTIKMLLGLTQADGGVVTKKEDLTVGYSPETPYFSPYMTGLETMIYYGRIQGVDKQTICQQAKALLGRVGLEIDGTKVKHYSKGMIQRLGLAQALLGEPELLILDEPTAGLDALGRIEMLQIIKMLKDEGKTVIINSHILADIEKVCDRGIMMKKGELMGVWENKPDVKGRSLEMIFVETVGGIL
ncbi:MAG: ABC transporter ATP-binding protein [Cellulosilyticaceae bacterium]